MRQPLNYPFQKDLAKVSGREILAFEFGMVQSTANEWIQILSDVMKPPRSKLRGITRKGIVCETPRFLTLFPLQGNLEASSEESPD